MVKPGQAIPKLRLRLSPYQIIKSSLTEYKDSLLQVKHGQYLTCHGRAPGDENARVPVLGSAIADTERAGRQLLMSFSDGDRDLPVVGDRITQLLAVFS